jgi:AraC family transcriptional regulator of adaptative response / DNA-3-methyladenine glycosylase II
MLRFLRVRAIKGLESVTSDSYSRVIEIDDTAGSIHVTHASEQCALRVCVRSPKLGALPTIIARVRRMFDLSADPLAIAAALSADPLLAPLVWARPGLRVPGGWDGLEIAVRAILGQQITVKAATQLASRIVAAQGTPIDSNAGHSELTHAFPRPEKFTPKNLAQLGMTKARAAAIATLAAAADKDPRLFDPHRDLDEAVARLCKLPGVGEWTAQYIAMRAMGETDAFLAGDVAVQRKLAVNGRRPTPAELSTRAQSWRPWRAYAVLHLWMAAETNDSKTISTKEIFHAIET